MPEKITEHDDKSYIYTCERFPTNKMFFRAMNYILSNIYLPFSSDNSQSAYIYQQLRYAKLQVEPYVLLSLYPVELHASNRQKNEFLFIFHVYPGPPSCWEFSLFDLFLRPDSHESFGAHHPVLHFAHITRFCNCSIFMMMIFSKVWKPPTFRYGTSCFVACWPHNGIQ